MVKNQHNSRTSSIESSAISTCATKLDNIITSRIELFSPDYFNQLKEKILEIEELQPLLILDVSPRVEIIGVVKGTQTWHDFPTHWAMLLVVIDSLHASKTKSGKTDATNEEENEEEKEAEGEEDGGEEGDDLSEFKELALSLRKNFTYIEQITVIVNSHIQRSPIASKRYDQTVNIYKKTGYYWQKFKSTVRSISEFIGLNLVFVVWLKIMKKFRSIEVATRSVGTVFLLLIAVLVYFIRPLWRFIQNPIERALNFFLKLFGIEAPEEE